MIQPLGDWREVLHSWSEVLRIGVPSIMTNLVGPVSMGVVFGLLAKYGHAVVAGFGVAVRIESLAVMILMAMSSSISPMVGQNWGAGQHDRIDAALRFGYRFSFAWGVFIFAVLATFGRAIVGLINNDPGRHRSDVSLSADRAAHVFDDGCVDGVGQLLSSRSANRCRR